MKEFISYFVDSLHSVLYKLIYTLVLCFICFNLQYYFESTNPVLSEYIFYIGIVSLIYPVYVFLRMMLNAWILTPIKKIKEKIKKRKELHK